MFKHVDSPVKSAGEEVVPAATAEKQPKISYSYIQLKQFEGVYYNTEINRIFSIKAAKDHLILQIDNDDLDLDTEKPLIFSFQGGMILSFIADKNITGFTLDVGDDVKGLSFVKMK